MQMHRAFGQTKLRFQQGPADNTPMNFILSDDQPLEQISGENVIYRSLGSQWLQGHMAIAIVHFLLDEGVDINR